MAKDKKFSFFDVILSVICVVFVAEAAAPATAIGNAQFFWWILLIITFLLPYGFIVAELGTSYDKDGGLYDWVRDAFGDKWGARVSWYYYINFPMWIASLAVLFPTTIAGLVGHELGVGLSIAIELAFVWIVVFLSFSKVSDSAWIMNAGAVLKVAIAVGVGIMGIQYGMANGFANPITAKSLLPDFTDVNSLTYLSIILFNFMGFEVVCTFTDAMEDPEKDMPKAIIAGGIAIAAIYLFSSFGISAAIPVADVSLDSGITDAVAVMVGENSPIFAAVSIMFLLTLFGNMVSWSFGVNSVACYAAKDGNMPKIFAKENEAGMPTGAAWVNGVIASLLILLQLVAGEDSSFFWIFFAMNVVFLLLGYIPMFPAFKKLRQVDPDHRRPFRCPAKGAMLNVFVWLPVVELILSIIATIVPLNSSAVEMEKIPMLIGVLVFVVLGEFVRIISAKGRTQEYMGIGRDPKVKVGVKPLTPAAQNN